MDSRERILKAAVELTSEQGLAGLSMREVARRAGVSHQAPYHHFENREAILAALAEDGFRKLNAALEAAAGRDAVGRLMAAGRAYVAFARSHPAHFPLMFRPELVDLEKHPPALEEARRGFRILESLVEAVVKEKRVPPRLAAGTVTLSWAFVQGLSLLLLEGPLGKMKAENAKSGDQIEAAFRAFEFLIAGRAR